MPYKMAEVDILIVPGWGNAGPDHWQARWAANVGTARRIEQDEWDRPMLADWVGRIAEAVAAASRPAVLVAHGCGVPAVIHAAQRLERAKMAGAFLVAPPDLAQTASPWPTADGRCFPAEEGGFHPVPSDPLPFPALVVASRNDPYVTFERARGFALDWGADFADAGDSSHLDTASGHGPWPEGLLRFGAFLRRLG